jgi:hypothetical protein
VKCSTCGEPVEHGGVSVAMFGESVFIVCLCEFDAYRMIGAQVLRRLKRAAGRSAWIQRPLPPPVGT